MITFGKVRPAHRFPGLGFLFILCRALAWGQGGTAVITLVMPPPGGEGYTALQSGAALAEGATAAYYNPAALAELYRSTGSTVGTTLSKQQLLPDLRLPDLYQDFQAGDLVIPDPGSGFDLGLGLFRNHVSFGLNTGWGQRTTHSDEWIWGLGMGIRLGLPISVGLSAKYIDSRLAQGQSADPDDGIARSWAFDFGILAMPRLSAEKLLRLPIVFTPSAAFTVSNVGPDVFYVEAGQSDPIPRTYTGAFGLRAEAWDISALTGHWQVEQEWTSRSDELSPVYNYGFLAHLFCAEFGTAYLVDFVGQRQETHQTAALAVDPKAWRRFLNLIRSRRGGTGQAQGDVPGSWEPFGVKVSLRPRLALGRHAIQSFDNGIRDHQESWYLSLSL